MERTTAMDTWGCIYSGKVRDLYVRTDEPERVLVVASDRVSAFDHILQTVIPDKGAILTAMSLWWFERLADEIRYRGEPLANHVLSVEVPDEVAGRAMVCRRLEMVPVECVARGYLTGSGLADYRATGAVCGNRLPDGLRDGSRLESPIFTPATKAAVGEHDENIGFDRVRALVGAQADDLRQLTLLVYSTAERIAADAGIVLADTKLEFGTVPGGDDRLVLADEVLTPDSSRFWPAEDWRPGRPQPSFDKQIVRDWLTSPASGWDRHGAEPPPPLPDEVVERTRERYLQAYKRLTGRIWR